MTPDRMHRWRRGDRPTWWPADEPWPPVGRPRAWRRGRARFMRRVAFVLAILLLFSALGVASLVSTLVRGRGAGGGTLAIAPAVAVIGLAAVSCILFILVVRRVGVPLGDIVEAANRVAGGDYATRVHAHGPPSLRTVANAFNAMAARLEVQDRQRRDLMADIAHELRTPLSVVQGRLEGILDGVYARDDAALAAALEETRTLARLVDDLRTLAHSDAGALMLQKEPTDVAVLVHDAVNSLSEDANAGRTLVRVVVSPDVPLVMIDPLRIREVLVNLLSNAVHHAGGGGSVSVTANLDGGRLAVAVADSGAGIPPEDLPRIFDRFYKGRRSRGSGLGLTIARNLVHAHGGDIRAASSPGLGTTITFTLPAS